MRTGTIHRIVGTLGIGYILDGQSGPVLAFRLSQVSDYKGQSLAEFGLVPGANVSFEANGDEAVMIRLQAAAVR